MTATEKDDDLRAARRFRPITDSEHIRGAIACSHEAIDEVKIEIVGPGHCRAIVATKAGRDLRGIGEAIAASRAFWPLGVVVEVEMREGK